jgi:hypothetical protein
MKVSFFEKKPIHIWFLDMYFEPFVYIVEWQSFVRSLTNNHLIFEICIWTTKIFHEYYSKRGFIWHSPKNNSLRKKIFFLEISACLKFILFLSNLLFNYNRFIRSAQNQLNSAFFLLQVWWDPGSKIACVCRCSLSLGCYSLWAALRNCTKNPSPVIRVVLLGS